MVVPSCRIARAKGSSKTPLAAIWFLKKLAGVTLLAALAVSMMKGLSRFR